MTTAVGTEAKVAIKKSAAAWAAAGTLGADNRLAFVSSGVTPTNEYLDDDDLNDSGGRGISNLVSTSVGGPLVINGDYRQPPDMLLAAMLMGAAGVPTESPPDVFLHVMKIQNNINGLYLHYGIDWAAIAGATWQYHSVKPGSRLIALPSSGKMVETYSLLGAGVTKGEDSSAWDYEVDPTDGGTIRVLHRHHVLRSNDQAGGALGSSDEQAATSIEIEITRNLGSDFTSGGELDEPVKEDFWRVELRVSFFGASAERLDLYRAAYDNATTLKADLVLDSGRLIPTTAVNYSRSFYFPKLRVIDAPLVVDGPGPLSFSVTMTAHQAASDPAGFPTGYVEAIIEEWVNDFATDPLA